MARSEVEAQGLAEWRGMLLHPSTLLLVAVDAIPAVGVVFWQWDAFVLLMLYWLDSAIIGLWTIARIAASPSGTMGPLLVDGRPATSSSLAVAAFFVLHSGMFMGVHLLFLWVMFSDDWSNRIHGVRDFVAQMVVATGVWLPLLLLFVGRGVSFLFHVVSPDLIRWIEQMLPIPGLPPPPAPDTGDLGAIIGGFYLRIVIMQVTIIVGAFIAVGIGSLAPLIILVVLKTLADIALHLVPDFGARTKQRGTPTLVAS
jgi:Family of unknown function (DUF6498)